MADLNTRMAAAGFNVTLQLFSHDFQMLPNGHWLIIANTVQSFTNLVGYPGNTDVTGDVVVDLDANLNPVWYWNEFDHFDVNRHPMGFPDWTHTNAVTYSVDDGDFIVSIRHQNWIVKVDYQNGAGTGNILWKLGEGGDFQLLNGVDPTDWFYAQHNSVFTGPNTAGIFNLALMDNGDDREFPPSVQCGSSGAPPCLYTTVPIMQINERAMTASFLFHQILPANLYNGFAGNTEVLTNTDVEYDINGSSPGSTVYEVTQQSSPAPVWQMNIVGTYDYRAFRMPSLYPGVQW
jgi:arylsulfate sulfotransferase